MAARERKERDRQRRKDDILKAAERIFALKGYHKAKIQDIAKEAQYGIGTVYLYFKDKNELYFLLLEERMKLFSEIVRDKTREIKGARGKIEVFIREGLMFFEQNRDFFRIYTFEKNSIQLVVGKKASEMFMQKDHIRDVVEELMDMAQKEGVLRKDCDLSEAADIFISITSSLTLRWSRDVSKGNQRLTDKTRFIFDTFMNGIGAK